MMEEIKMSPYFFFGIMEITQFVANWARELRSPGKIEINIHSFLRNIKINVFHIPRRVYSQSHLNQEFIVHPIWIG
jgi:hypothetical protein